MTSLQLKYSLMKLVNTMPHDVFHHLCEMPTLGAAVPWCICGRCRQKEDNRMNVCCGHQICITTTTTFYNVCGRADVIEIANILKWSYQFNDEPSFEHNVFRNQAYRNFVMWQWGRLGAGIRRVVPSSVVIAIGSRVPSPDGQYTGYHSSEEL